MTDVHSGAGATPRPVLSRRGLLSGIAGATASAILAACGGTPTLTPAPTTAAATAAGSVTAPTRAPGGTAAAASPLASAAPAGSAPAAGATVPAAAGGPTFITAPTPAASTGRMGGQVSMYWPKPVSLAPLFSTQGSEQTVERLMFGALVKVTDRLDAVPDLAERVAVSPDAKTYTFSLKQGITFTDGQPLTAADVVFTIERAVDKRSGSGWRGRLLNIQGAADYGDQKADHISGIETPDARTVKMTLATPDSTWLTVLGNFAGLGILPQHVLKDVAPDQLQKHPFSLAPNVTAGAFQFVSFQQDQYLQVKRNDGYTAGPKAKLDAIFLKILAPDTAVAQLERGELDLLGTVLPSDAARLKQNASLTVVSVPSPSVSFLTYNGDKPYLKDKRVRQAVQYAIDRAGIVSQIYGGEAQVVNSSIIGPDWMGIPAGLNPYPFDPAKAKQLLKDANWDSGRKLGLIYTSAKDADAFMPIIQQQCKDAGLTVDLLALDPTEYTRRLVTTNDYEVALVGGGVFRQDPNVSANYFASVNFTPNGGNYARYANPRVDALFAMGRALTDTNERKKIYTELAGILNDEVPWTFLWSPNSIFAYNKRLQGFKPPSYANNQLWNADEWSVTGG